MKLSLLPLLSILVLPALGQQTKLNLRLQRELDSLQGVDLKYRHLMGATRNPRKADSLETVLHLDKGQLATYAIAGMQRVDSSNLRRMEAIMQRYGYPGKSLVGPGYASVAWQLIMHSDKIPQYLPLIKAAAEKSEMPYFLYAQMLDRQLMAEGKAQLYGTQAAWYRVRNKQTGQPEQVIFLWPVADPTHADERRRKAGFSNTLAESAQSLVGTSYKPVTLDYAKHVQQEAATLYKKEQQTKLQ